MADMRSCIKTGCRWPAAATLSYRYTTSEVWLSDLGEPHPATHDLCPHHADTLTVPRGWRLVDDRRPAAAVHEPSAAEIVERVTSLRTSVDAMLEDRTPRTRRSRYAALLETLPTYDPPEDPDLRPDAGQGDGNAAHEGREGADPTASTVRGPAMLVPIGVSHEMAPIAREMTTTRSVLAQRYADRVATVPAATRTADHEQTVDVTDGPSPADAHADGPSATTDAGSGEGRSVAGHSGAGRSADGPSDAGCSAGNGSTTSDDGVHETGLRGAVVLTLPFRGGDDPTPAG